MNQFLSLTLRGGSTILINVGRITDISPRTSNGTTLICFGGPEESDVEVTESLEQIYKMLTRIGQVTRP